MKIYDYNGKKNICGDRIHEALWYGHTLDEAIALTDRIIEILNNKSTPVVFILWGGNARAKKALITNPKHLVLESAHPSPLSAYAGFFGCNHFIKANSFLTSRGLAPIEWDKINDF